MTNLPVTPTVLRPQPQLPPAAAAAAVAAAAAAAAAVTGHLNNVNSVTNATARTNQMSPLRIRVSSPNRINSDLTSIVHQQHGLSISNRTNGVTQLVGGNGTNGPPTSIAGLSSIGVGPPMLHRPFSPSPQPKDVS